MVSNQIGQGTAQGLIDYLEMLVDKGRATHGAIQPLKTAFTKVLEAVDGSGWQQTKVVDIDIEDYIDRFGNLTRGTYTSQSLAVYKSRVTRAVGWYKKFMNETGWMPNIKARAPRQKAAVKLRTEKSQIGNNAIQNFIHQTGSKLELKPEAQGESITYPFPLFSGEIAQISMPKSAKKDDMKRLATFLEALVVSENSND